MVPDVTAIVTCMSDAERPFLTETLQSVRNQTVPCETIVVVLESKPGLMKYRKRCPDYALSDGRLAGLERRPTAGLEQSNGVHRLSGRRRCLVAHKDGEARGFNEIRPRRDTIISHPFDPDMRQGEDGAGGSALGTQCVSTASLRPLITEIVVDITESTIHLIIHWQGGDHTRLEIRKNRARQTRWSTDDDVIGLIEAMARQMPDKSIAAVLNRSGKQPGAATAGHECVSVLSAAKKGKRGTQSQGRGHSQ